MTVVVPWNILQASSKLAGRTSYLLGFGAPITPRTVACRVTRNERWPVGDLRAD
jgi:hypothetical protein